MFPALVQKLRPRLRRFSSGTCTCSRRALIIARCPHCARADLALAAEEAAEEEPEDPDLMDGALVASVPGPAEHIGGVIQVLTSAIVLEGFLAGHSAEKPSSRGLLFIQTKLKTTGSTPFPTTPRSHPFRMMFLCTTTTVHLVQRCVNSRFETVTEFDFGAAGFSACTLVSICSMRWLVLAEPSVPLLAATHRHRHVRGRVSIGGRWVTVAQISAGYSPEFSALFGRCWSSALAALTTRAPRSVSTAFSSGPRQQF